ncbi:MAG: radical SAM protein [Acidobacteriota bacterium]
MPFSQGTPIVLTAPLTESIEHAGFFIQMAMASMPSWMEKVLNWKYPNWKDLPREQDNSAKVAPCGLRVVEETLKRIFGPDQVVVADPEMVDRFIGPETRIVAVSTHNPLGTTFAAGVYASLFGSSREPINAKYTKDLLTKIHNHPCRANYKVILGGSGSWQLPATNMLDQLGIDCVVEGRAESKEVQELFRHAYAGQAIPRTIHAHHPASYAEMIVPQSRTSFGVIEMTTGCGRRCSFCVPDLNPRVSFPKEDIMKAVEANLAQGGNQISLATEDMFIWEADTYGPFFKPNNEALIDLYHSIAEKEGVKHILLSHSTIAPAVLEPELIRELAEILLPKSPIRLPRVSTHPEKRVLSPLIGIETGSARMGQRIMAGKALPFQISDWPSIVINGLEILNRNNWFPVLTLIIGAPDETDDDCRATLDLLYETERRGLHAFWVPSIFTPLEGTRNAHDKELQETRQISRLQWQVLMKAWQLTSHLGLGSKTSMRMWAIGSFIMWGLKLRWTNGPNFTWPLFLFSGAISEDWMHRTGKLYQGQPLKIKTREELIASISSKNQQAIATAAAKTSGLYTLSRHRA